MEVEAEGEETAVKDNARMIMASNTATSSQQKSAISDTVAQASKAVDDVTNKASEMAHHTYENFGAVGGEFDRAIRKSLREQPMMTLGLAAAFGFVLGAIWKN